jgi:hypothetical protein
MAGRAGLERGHQPLRIAVGRSLPALVPITRNFTARAFNRAFQRSISGESLGYANVQSTERFPHSHSLRGGCGICQSQTTTRRLDKIFDTPVIENSQSAARIRILASITFSVVPTGLFNGACQPRTASWVKFSKFSRPYGTRFREMAALTQTLRPCAFLITRGCQMCVQLACQAIAAQASVCSLVGDREYVGKNGAPAVMPRGAGHGGVAL